MQLLVFCFVSLVFGSGEPNPPNWPSNVYIFDPSTPGHTQNILDQAFSQNGGHNPPFNGQFSSSRYAFLFKPGTHNVVVNVGFYTQVMGLGQSPSDTNIATVKCENGDFNYQGGALDNFWRSAENFQSGSTLWAVSQASPLRRINVNGDLSLFQYNSGCCAGYASGGFLADSVVSGQIISGSQQQWFTRNTHMGKWNGGVWNMVFVGNNGGPASHCGDTKGQPFTTVQATPVIAEKPFITVSGNSFQLRIPQVEFNKVGNSNYQNVPSVDFSNVFVARPSDSYSTINSKLASGLHVILSPGIYQLSGAIRITRANTVVLGLGFPTLETTNGDPCIIVSNVDGVRVSGILLQASRTHSPSLLQWGTGGYSGSSANPGFAHDIFARVGGTNNPSQYQVSTDQIVQINSGNVVIDNAWLWRADHDISGNVYGSMNPSKNGLVVNGDSVTTYGLAIEHNLQDQLVWNGERGRTYFYQSELPYDVNQANFGNPGYAGYRVGNNVQNHLAFGPGVYCFFRDYSVVTPNAIVTPSRGGIMFVNSMTKFLNGNGGINHVINGKGDAVHTGGTGIAYVCQN